MVAIYVRWIQTDRMTLAEVPALWREQVDKKLAEAAQTA